MDDAVHRVPEDARAWSYRDAVWSGVIEGTDPDPAGAGVISSGASPTGRRSTLTRWAGLRELPDGGGPGARACRLPGAL
jgi:hypothetical protein